MVMVMMMIFVVTMQTEEGYTLKKCAKNTKNDGGQKRFFVCDSVTIWVLFRTVTYLTSQSVAYKERTACANDVTGKKQLLTGLRAQQTSRTVSPRGFCARDRKFVVARLFTAPLNCRAKFRVLLPTFKVTQV